MARYSKGAQKTVKEAMHKRKKGTLKSGSGKKVKSLSVRVQGKTTIFLKHPPSHTYRPDH